MGESSIKNFGRDIWNFFASMQLSVVIILFLAVTSIFGTLIEQKETMAHNVQHYGPFVAQFLDTLGFFDLYHAFWYQGAFLILALNIIVCSIDKLNSTWNLIFKKDLTFSLPRFEKMKNRIDLNLDGDVESEIRKSVKKFSAKFIEEKEGDRTTFYAESGRKTRLGVYLVHISILFMIAGGIIGWYTGFEGFVNIPEGAKVSSVISRDRMSQLNLGFELKCTDFDVKFYDNSRMAKEYRSDLVVIKDGKEVLKKSIIVNDPLRYDGISFYQSSYGQSGIPEEVTAVFKSNDTGMEYSKKMKFGDAYTIPEGLGTFTLEKFGKYNFRGQPLGDAIMGNIKRDGKKIEVAVPVAHPNFDMMRSRMNKGRVVVSFKDLKRKYYTGLQVSKDPGIWWVYSGFIMLIAGCYITFFMCHRSLCVSIKRKGGKSSVMISGSANKNKQGMKLWLKRFASKIEKGSK